MSLAKLLLRLCVGATLVYLLVCKHEVSFEAIKEHFANLSAGVVALALGLYLAGQLLSAYRWSRLSTMGGRPAQFADVWPVYFTGMFFNMCLPTSIGGDVWRVVGLSRKTGSKSGALASVFMDRNVGLSALLVVGLIASIAAPKLCTIEATLFKTNLVLPLWPLFLLLLLGFIGANVAIFSDSFCRLVTYVTTSLRLGFIGSRIEKLHNSVQAFRQPVSGYFNPFVLSIIYQLSEVAVVMVLATGMGINLSPFVFGAIVTFQAVAALLPITFNGVGVREAIFCAVLKGQLGDGIKDEALALSLAYFGILLMSSLTGGVVYLLSGMQRPSAAESGAEPVINSVASGQ
jgi:uncharacterized protein (TIRG00374 family)